ncbi:DNA-binding transcriptional regulator, MarR family [Clostridium acidisoli DSM 12555]|uniref:DNA-binding transcriptional regulator, MarR family n=1 Tax=Clostridium acidisoli DSM 12555 TaxID=1121291 RepID=A0A1W1WYK3_9CLOT|nr:MarR family winged helix-turn-helix transcriptional regulator [Clostridium acidisoli]SMC16687.1 DNA-binding transcriptional regulator, MarR family [Clostridium acidisoli DSM 12555]
MDYSDFKVKQAGDIVQSFMDISKVLTKLTSQNAESLGLTLLQMGILNLISASPEITLKEITDKLNISKSTVSVNVDNLVNLELIDRKVIEEDRREIHLTSTPKGKALSKKSSENALSYRAMIFALDKIPKEDIDVLMRIHKELLNQFQSYLLNYVIGENI